MTINKVLPSYARNNSILYLPVFQEAIKAALQADGQTCYWDGDYCSWKSSRFPQVSTFMERKGKKKKIHEVISVQVCRWRHTHSLCFLWDQLGQVSQLAPGHLSDPGEQKRTIYYKFLFEDNATCKRSLFLSATAHKRASRKWLTLSHSPPAKIKKTCWRSSNQLEYHQRCPFLFFSCHLAALGSPSPRVVIASHLKADDLEVELNRASPGQSQALSVVKCERGKDSWDKEQ